MKCSQVLLAALVPSLIFSSVVEAKSLINSGGTCTSQGVWTSRALEQSQRIMSTIEQLRDDPDCGKLVAAIAAVGGAGAIQEAEGGSKDFAKGPAARYEELPSDLLALRTVLTKNPDNAALNKRLSPILAKSTVDMVANNASLVGALNSGEVDQARERLKNTMALGGNLLSAIFANVPKDELCLHKAKNSEQGLAIISASIRMMSALSSGGDSTGQSIAGLMSQFNTFITTMQYNKLINKLNVAQFWTEMSCLVETTQQSYCSAKDALQLLDYQGKEAQVMADLRDNISKGSVAKDSAIEGYLLLGREATEITTWLQKVQSGVQAKNTSDANFKNEIWNTVVGLTQNINLLQGRYNENLQVYQGLTAIDQKQQNIRMLLRDISGLIQRQPGTINFFTQAVQPEFLPFYLMGRSQIPAEVLGTTNGIPMDPFVYLNDLNKTGELKDPDSLMNTILERLSSLSDLALGEGSKYFSQNMTIDHVNLVDETFANSDQSIYDSLKIIRAYISRLALKYARTKGDGQRLTLSMADTIARIDRVLGRFDEVSAAAAQYNILLNKGRVDLSQLNTLTDEQQEHIRVLHKNLITTVYDQLNLLMQKDAFISQRLSTYVRFDLYQRLKTQEDLSPYMQYLLLASGNGVLNRMEEVGGFNAATAKADLATAQSLNRENIDVMENLFAGDVWNYLNKLAQESGNNYIKRSTDNPFNSLFQAFKDIPKGIWNEFRYLPGRYKKIANQDEDGVIAFLRAKMCIQTLGFKQWYKFQDLCKGAVLEGPMTASAPKDLNLKFNYDELAKEKELGLWDQVRLNFGGSPGEGKRYQHTCSLRDYFRNNQVYWLTLQFGPDAGDLKPAARPTEKKPIANPFD